MEAVFRGAKLSTSAIWLLSGLPTSTHQFSPSIAILQLQSNSSPLLASPRTQARSEARRKGEETVKGTRKIPSGALGDNKNNKKINPDTCSNH